VIADVWSRPKELGVTALVLALLAVMTLCLPLVGLVAVPLSGLGLLLGLRGLCLALWRGDPARLYPLAGGACSLLVLLLALLPRLSA
jgi:hypothetical protein